MDTVIYLINASEVIPKNNIKNICVKDNNMMNIESIPLSVSGEEEAAKLSHNKELKDIDSIYSSNYVSAISTAKYIAIENNTIVSIDERLNERKVGQLSSMDMREFNRMQVKDSSFKLNGGESLDQTKKRVSDSIKNIIMFETGNRIAVVSHNIAILCMLSAWCDNGTNYNDEMILTYNEEPIYDGSIESPSLFKITFDGMIVTNVEKIDIN